MRIATAFFEPSGYQCLQDFLAGKNVRLLIGREYGESGGVAAVVREFSSRLTEGPLEDRTEAMELMRHAIAQGKLVARLGRTNSTSMFDARHLHHHAKLYIADENRAVVASSNMTWTGLVRAREAGYMVENPEDVRYFVERFDEYYNEAESLTEELLAVLDSWLSLHSPYHVYVRSLLGIYGLPSEERNQRLPELAAYQVPVVSKLLQILRERRGGMLVASTGLGKTVMAAHLAAYLFKEGLVNNVLLFCPAGLREMWNRMLASVRIRCKEYSYHALSVDDWKKNRQVRELEYELRHADENTLLIIDESHHLRNEEETRNFLRLRNERIIRTVRQGGYVVLMTATPYSRGVEDINSQLRMIPETAEQESLYGPSRWSVRNPAELSELPVSVVLTAPTVVNDFSETDESGERFVIFSGSERRYFPRMMSIHSVTYRNDSDAVLFDLLKSGLLHVNRGGEDGVNDLFDTNYIGGKRDALQEARFIHQFCSSIAEADLLLQKMGREKGQGFEKIRFARQNELSLRISDLRRRHKEALSPEGDDKLDQLFGIIDRHSDRKILIFCVYKNTARYLNERLRAKGLVADSTVDRDPDHVDLILRRFAPQANDVLPEDPGYDEIVKNPIDILIATGSLTEGFNLQDASVLVNFDLPWTVLVLAQRMGRILRPWPEPRTIHIYNLIPSTMQKEEFYLAIRWRDRLADRNRDLKSFSDLPVLHDNAGSEEVEMISLARNMQQFGDSDMMLDDVLEFLERTDNLQTSSFLGDLSKIDPNFAEDVQGIPAGFSSTKNSDTKGLYVLFRYRGVYYPSLFRPDGSINQNSEASDAIMAVIRSKPDEDTSGPLEAATIKEREHLLSRCRDVWAADREIDPDEACIECYMSLV